MNSFLPVFQSYYSSRPNIVLPQNLSICYSLYLMCAHLLSAPLCTASSCLLFLSHFRLPLPWPLALNQLPSLSFLSPCFLYLHRPYYHWNIIIFSYLFTCLFPLSPTTHTPCQLHEESGGFIYLSTITNYVSLDQWFWNVDVHQNHREGLLRHRLLGPTKLLIQQV